MKFGELKFILDNSIHTYGIDGKLCLVGEDYVTKRAVITLEESFEMLPFSPGDINVKVAIDEAFVFECTNVEFIPKTNTLDLKIVATNVASC